MAPSMDKITTALLSEFSTTFGIEKAPEDDRFEQFATYLTVRKHYSESAFLPADLVTGKANDTGIDAIAVIVNNNLVTDLDAIQDLLEVNGFLDVAFCFVQAERSPHFETARVGQFGFGVRDFFGEGKLKRNETVQNYADIMNALFKSSSKFRPANPSCHMYYVTTGKWQEGGDLSTRASSEVNYLEATGMFSKVEFHPVGVDQIQKLYNQTKNAITREFVFAQKTVVPDVHGVKEAYLGFLPASDFLKLVCDEDEKKIIKSLFYENVRDWAGYNQINKEMRETLTSGVKDRFILMNNGVTIIARTLQTTGNKFVMGDFYVVNGCQTSHVLHDNQELLNESVRIPVRLICTQDEGVIESIIKATNRQTEVRDDQFFAMKDFAKKLELYFKSFPIDQRLYYERRSHQFDNQDIARIRIVVHQNLVRAVGAMFLGEPHITTRTFRQLSAKVGKEMFADTDNPDPYYVSALALYRLEQLFNSKIIEAKYKAARFQILFASRLLMDGKSAPKMNSHEIVKRCEAMREWLWDDAKVEKLFADAIAAVEKVAGAKWDRDSIRTEPVTKAILESFAPKKEGSN